MDFNRQVRVNTQKAGPICKPYIGSFGSGGLTLRNALKFPICAYRVMDFGILVKDEAHCRSISAIAHVTCCVDVF